VAGSTARPSRHVFDLTRQPPTPLLAPDLPRVADQPTHSRLGHQVMAMKYHPLAHNHCVMSAASVLYTIRINGHLGATVLQAFPGLVAQREAAQTVLTGLLDRSALYGVLAEIETLGLDLVEIRRLSDAPDPRDPDSGRSF
jgi:hypothetical protein